MNSLVEIDPDTSINDEQNKAKKAILPPIRKNNSAKVDYIPSNLLVTLTQNGQHFEDLGPGGKKKLHHKRPDNVWNHKKQRSKFKHLLEQPACFCGAGRDISYLVDTTGNVKKDERCEDKQHENQVTKETIDDYNKNCIPETIIPSEFHVVKHQGVAALNIQDDMYKTSPGEHEKHLTVFPSLRPAGRQEAVQLLQTMNDLLKKAGVRDFNEDNHDLVLEDENDSGKQIEELLSLVKEEQKIYNIIFHEIIRQVSIECVERGSVLAELRNRYAKILDRVPKQVKSLHEEVIAQKALDRRLTEELTRFKTSISLLTKELYEIHSHDEEVTRQAELTQVELSDALRESEKNASLLAEYHDLYEMQRRRLDYQLARLIEERDLWAGSAHMLLLKVTKKHNLVSVQRLHLYEKSWHKLATKFTTLLMDTDDKQLQVSSKAIHDWQNVALSFHEKLCDAERQSGKKIQNILEELRDWSCKFESVVTPDDGLVKPLDKDEIASLYETLKSWEHLINEQIERFTGDTLLSSEDDLLQLNTCVDAMINAILKVFHNHPNQDNSVHPQLNIMYELRKTITRLHTTFQLRMCGENGLSRNFIYLINTLDTWVSKLNILLNGGETLFDSEWIQLSDFIQQQWKDSLESVLRIFALTDNLKTQTPMSAQQTPSQESWASLIIDVNDVVKATQDWLENVVDVFQREDSNIIEQINSTHSNMIRWIITVLILIVPDMGDDDMADVERKVSEDNIKGLGEAILAESSPDVIFDRAIVLFNWIRSLTDLVSMCCKNVVVGDVQDVNMEDSKNNDDALKDLKRFEVECQGWMRTANFLLHDITGKTVPLENFAPPKLGLPNTESSTEQREDTPSESVRSSVPCDTPRVQGKSPQLQSEDRSIPQRSIEVNTTDHASVIAETESSDHSQFEREENFVSTEVDMPIHSEEVKQVNERIDKDDESNENEVKMHVIGPDDNVKKTVVALPSQNQQEEQEDNRIDLKLSTMSLESISLLENLQAQLVESEERAQNAEQRVYEAEKKLKEAQEQIRALERSLSHSCAETSKTDNASVTNTTAISENENLDSNIKKKTSENIDSISEL